MPELHGHWVGDHWVCHPLPNADRPYRDLPLTEVARKLVEATQELCGPPWAGRSTAISAGCAAWAEIASRETP